MKPDPSKIPEERGSNQPAGERRMNAYPESPQRSVMWQLRFTRRSDDLMLRQLRLEGLAMLLKQWMQPSGALTMSSEDIS